VKIPYYNEENPQYVIELIKKLVTVSIKSVEIIKKINQIDLGIE